jgi:hypothetical protein
MTCICGRNLYAKGLCVTCYNIAWRAENTVKVREYAQAWHEAHPEKQSGYYRKFYAANTAKVQTHNRKWRVANPEIERTIKHRRRAKEAGNGGSWSVEEWIVLKQQYNNCCICCGKSEADLKSLNRILVPDHVIPISRGGTSFITNIQPLCHGKGGCNNRKNARHIDYRRIKNVGLFSVTDHIQG